MSYSNYNNSNKNNSVFLFNNPYGFKININHPLINTIYRRFKDYKRIPAKSPLSNNERKEFENFLIHSKEFKTILKQTGETIPLFLKK
jgi:hypothetical protein